MRIVYSSLVRRALDNQSGQTMIIVALLMSSLMGAAGLVIDLGHVYWVKSQLQNTANAAALAAAGLVYTSDSATVNTTTEADLYGATGTENPDSYATTPPTVQKICMNMLMPSGTTCNSSSAANAVRVTQTGTVKTWFMAMFGIPTLKPTVIATASTLGGQAQPWNVAIILDGTGSMTNSDSNCGYGQTQFSCATGAIQTMLAATNPCDAGYTSCPTSNARLKIALFSFPGISTNTVVDDTTNCTTPTFMLYTLPQTAATSYTPLSYSETTGNGHNQTTTTFTATYEIVPFSSDWFSTTTSNHLNPNSTLVNTISGCMSPITQTSNVTGALQGAPYNSNGGVTYYAAPIYAAQDALIAQQAANQGSQNAIILLSDGQANLPSGADDFPSQQGATLATGSSGFTSPTGTGLYPDLTDECQQAIMAAQAATTAGTRVYSVSYGSESQGCSYTSGSYGSTGSYGTDNTTVATGWNAPFTAATITPCITMENIASSLQYFYSDYNQTNSGNGTDKNCIDNAHPVSSLQNILLAIVSDFLRPRLLPNNAPFTVITGS